MLPKMRGGLYAKCFLKSGVDCMQSAYSFQSSLCICHAVEVLLGARIEILLCIYVYTLCVLQMVPQSLMGALC